MCQLRCYPFSRLRSGLPHYNRPNGSTSDIRSDAMMIFARSGFVKVHPVAPLKTATLTTSAFGNVARQGRREFREIETMKTTIQLSSIVLAFFSVTVLPTARAVCQEGCIGTNNTRLGENTLFSLTSGFTNTAVVSNALAAATNGSGNTAMSFIALLSNTTGFNNAATGTYTLKNNTTGSNNTATGASALATNEQAKATRQQGTSRSTITQPGATTRPAVLMPSLATPLVKPIRPPVIMRSRTTQPAAAISR
jgi:hypothetical protein